MTLDRQFVRACIEEKMPNVWSATITYSYYSLYNFEEQFISPTLKGAERWVLEERCGRKRLMIVNRDGLNV